MQDEETSNGEIPSGIVAVFESREWIDFVNHAHNPRTTAIEKFHKSSLVLKKDSGTISGRGACAFTFH